MSHRLSRLFSKRLSSMLCILSSDLGRAISVFRTGRSGVQLFFPTSTVMPGGVQEVRQIRFFGDWHFAYFVHVSDFYTQ